MPAGSISPRTSGRPPTRPSRSPWNARSGGSCLPREECDVAFVHAADDPVVVGASVRAALAAHANAELPNEACGLVLFEDDVAVEYVPGRNASPSPYHFELVIDPLTWADLNDRDLTQAVFHSHISSPPRPSRTDVQNIGLWAGQPYLVYTIRTDELAAWRILGDGSIEAIPLASHS